MTALHWLDLVVIILMIGYCGFVGHLVYRRIEERKIHKLEREKLANSIKDYSSTKDDSDPG